MWVCDGFLGRGRYDARSIHRADGITGRYWGWRGFNPRGYAALAAGMLAAASTMKSPIYDGPLAAALGGTDLSWVLGFPVSAIAYALFSAPAAGRLRRRAEPA